MQLIDLLRREDEQESSLVSRLLLCRFLSASTLIVMARSEDNIERSVSIGVDFCFDVTSLLTLSSYNNISTLAGR